MTGRSAPSGYVTPSEMGADRARFAAALGSRVGRVVGHVLKERVRPLPLRTAADVPRTPDDATPAWLTACLCAGHPGAAVVAAENLGGSAGTTTRRRFRITYNDAGRAAGLPEHVYAKTTASAAERLMLGLTGTIQVEGQVYDRVLPLVDIEVPDGCFSSFEPRSWRSLVLTEDVTVTRGASFYTPQTELTFDHIKALLTAMATWNGTLWEHPVLAGGWLHTTAQRQAQLSKFLDWGKRSVVGCKRARPGHPPRRRGAGFERSMQLGSAGPMTLLHGDPHTGGNFYVTGGGRMGWADRGVCLQGSWGYDYGYLVAASLPTDRRREWERSCSSTTSSSSRAPAARRPTSTPPG